MSDIDPQGHEAPDADAGHEPGDIGLGRIVGFGAALVVVSAVAMIAMAGLMRYFSTEERKDGTTTADIAQDRPGDFPSPRLQHDDAHDMAEFREREDAALKSYGWVDRKAGIAQIPIDDAIKILAEKGLPKVKAPEPPKPPESKPATEPKPGGNEPAKKE
jgi:hypothetical protein